MPKHASVRILVVDDMPDNRDLYAEYLTHRGYAVVAASNGQQALELAAKGSFDLIIMDLALPVMDGWEATRRLKSNPRTRSIPIIALTGHVEPLHRQRALDAGCDRYLTKPHLPKDLHEEICSALAKRAENDRAAPNPRSADRSPRATRRGPPPPGFAPTPSFAAPVAARTISEELAVASKKRDPRSE